MRRSIALTLTALLLLTACVWSPLPPGGRASGGAPPSAPTLAKAAPSAPTLAKAPPNVPTLVKPPPGAGALPARPASFDQYPAAIADFLNQNGANVGWLKQLLLKWGAVSGATPIFAGNMTGDGRTDLLVAIYQTAPDRGANDKIGGILWLHQPPGGQWQGEFAARPDTGASPAPDAQGGPSGQGGQSAQGGQSGNGAPPPSVIDLQIHYVGDLTADGRDELLWSSAEMGANTGFQHVKLLSRRGNAWAEGLSVDQTWGEVHVNPGPYWNGPTVILAPGFAGSWGAGPQRQVSQFYQWQDGKFGLFRQELGSNRYMPLRFVDAEWQLLKGDEAAAAALYVEVLTDQSLLVWPEGENPDGRPFYRTLAAFRQMAMAAKKGDTARVRSLAHFAEHGYPPLAPVVSAFADTYAKGGSYPAACQAARKQWPAKPDTSDYPYYWGFTNPTFTADNLCPDLFGYKLAGGTPEVAKKTSFQ